MVHVGYHAPTIVGDYCSITHRVVLHGCTIGDHCLIAIGATIMEGAVIGENSIVGGHAFVPDGMIVPPNSIVMGTPAKVVRTRNNFVANRINAHALSPQCAVLRARRAPRLGRPRVRGGGARLAGGSRARVQGAVRLVVIPEFRVSGISGTAAQFPGSTSTFGSGGSVACETTMLAVSDISTGKSPRMRSTKRSSV